MTTLYKADKKADKRLRPQKVAVNTEPLTWVRRGGAWAVWAVRATRIALSQATLRDNVSGFRTFRRFRESVTAPTCTSQ